MTAVRPAVLFVALLLGPMLAGCLGGMGDDVASPGSDPPNPSPAHTEAEERFGLLGPQLRPWTRDLGEPLRQPVRDRLMPLVHQATDTGQLRLLSDGSTFVLVVEDDRLIGQDWAVFAHVVDVKNNVTVARGSEGSSAAGGRSVPYALDLALYEPLRLSQPYALEVIVVTAAQGSAQPAWRDAGAPLGIRVSNDSSGSPMSRFGECADDCPDPALSVAASEQRGEASSFDLPLSFRPSWQLSFDGPTTGTDRPDPFERNVFGGPETGTYTAKLTAERLWLATIEVDLASSEIADSVPSVAANGTTGFRIDVVGHRPLDAFLYLPRSRGVDQSFQLELKVDYEMFDDLQTEDAQFFSFIATMGYRIGGQTYVAAVDGRDIRVELTQEPTPPL